MNRPGAGAPTLRRRIRDSMLLLTVTVLAVVATVVYACAHVALFQELDTALFSLARAEVASSTDGPGGRLHVHSDGYGTLREPVGNRLGITAPKLARIEDRAGRMVAETEALQEGPPLRTNPGLRLAALAGKPALEHSFRGAEPVRVIYFPFHDQHGTPHLSIVALSERPILAWLRYLAWLLCIAVALMAAVVAWGAHRLAARLTAPLEQAARAAREVSEGSLERRVPRAGAEAEVLDLTEALNDMIDRLTGLLREREATLAAQQRFVTDASHELRSPLASLRGTLEVTLRRGRTAAEYRQAVSHALVETQRLCRLASDLLTLARADAGELELSPLGGDLAGVARDSVAAHAATAATRGVALETDLPDRLPVVADSDRMRQVLDNLLDNALRYAPTGSAVRLEAKDEPDRVVLSVVDHGPGIPPEFSERVFDRFFRADAGRARTAGGTGLGLAISRAILRAHRGDLLLDSRTGEGARFTLLLPRDLSPA